MLSSSRMMFRARSFACFPASLYWFRSLLMDLIPMPQHQLYGGHHPGGHFFHGAQKAGLLAPAVQETVKLIAEAYVGVPVLFKAPSEFAVVDGGEKLVQVVHGHFCAGFTFL